MTHEIKILPKYFDAVMSGAKNFEIRKNDRDYKVGDTLILKEWDCGKFTGRELERVVGYIYYGDQTYGLSEDHCVMALKQGEKMSKQECDNCPCLKLCKGIRNVIPITVGITGSLHNVKSPYCICLMDNKNESIAEKIYSAYQYGVNEEIKRIQKSIQIIGGKEDVFSD